MKHCLREETSRSAVLVSKCVLEDIAVNIWLTTFYLTLRIVIDSLRNTKRTLMSVFRRGIVFFRVL